MLQTPQKQPEPIQIALAGAPRGKGRPRFARAGSGVRTYTDAATRSYEGDLRAEAAKVMAGRAPLEGPILVSIHAFMPVPASWSKKKRQDALSGVIRPTTKPDIDNIAKLLDALNEVVFRDDKQITTALVAKSYSARPCLVINVSAEPA